MQKGDMVIDETINIDFPMRDILKEDVEALEKAFVEDDISTWEIYWDIIGIVAKNEHACGYITSDQMHAIWERYYTGG